MSRPDDDGFLTRWSRRKLSDAVEVEDPASGDGPGEAQGLVPEAGVDSEVDTAGKTDAELLEALGLPDPDALVEGDDFSAFMAKGIPARLRNRALRKLWRANPALGFVDGLLDYDEDFTDAAKVIEGMATAWQVGRGFRTDDDDVSSKEDADQENPDDDDASDQDTPDQKPGTNDGAPEDATAEDPAIAAGPGPAADQTAGLPNSQAEESPFSASEAASEPDLYAQTALPNGEDGPILRPRRMKFHLPEGR